ncbi:MAG: hypothetical protein NC911_05070, partial [Candidatus Omnitrophica bacterium]|nr:hypothetical protein [Candidatus Omnitrophota bacterium]
EQLLPFLDAYAIGSAGPVIVNVKQAGGVKYVSLVNNARKKGIYTEWTKNDNFQPYGVEQEAICYLKVPETSVVYEFTESRQLPVSWNGTHLVTKVILPPHQGRLLCVYPTAITTIEINCPESFSRGSSEKIRIRVLDSLGQTVSGRQLVSLTVLDGRGEVHDESSFYPVRDGQLEIPIRIALNDPAGTWKIEVTERTTGLATNHSFLVK